MTRSFSRQPIATAIGLLLGLFLALVWPQMVGVTLKTYDSLFPVLEMQGEVVEVDSNAVTLHISGRKLRGEECRMVGIYGYTHFADDIRRDAIVERVDMPAAGRARQQGTYDIGLWRVYPVPGGALRVSVQVQHTCAGRTILSTVADVQLVKG